jgi:hypothetical protein
MNLTPYVGGLRARFDAAALRPPAPLAHPQARAKAAELLARQPAARAGLQAWCWRGAGPGNAAWWRPGAQPAVDLRLATAVLHARADPPAGPPGAPPSDAPSEAPGTAPGAAPQTALARAWADAWAGELDGSQHLAALPGATAGLALRLGVKRADAMWWRERQPTDPWDAGWAIAEPAARPHWQTAFMPRRATLILADGREFKPLSGVLAALAARSAHFRHPVRWLWVGGSEAGALAPGLTRFELG